ncbi:SusC/RagA family TonB-linked outer membrane protein [Chryseobacterium sp.]|uniref:SusC/RagA family TonB-linked outer membrane protein n=1 Tax=Chryseobacterium sp. TaxID=1871047 RepID=UPI0012A83113|nr:SusC/RagA family TonB-linked outer membrane protein [Chryseobacterium sp.]QFG53453.1 SusC/RagA family TonB-linked outer membrane protein [Chryseobacterium sp.]
MKKNLPPLYGAAAFLMLSAFCSHTRAQTLTVSGTVTHNGQPLSGVTVSQEGSTQATVTNSSGRYQLSVSGADPGIIFRHPNHPLWREEVAGRTAIDVELGAKVQQIQEVTINAGYYTVKDKERTGSIAKVTAKDIENQPVTNVLSAIQGRMAGVSITQGGGNPGGGFDIQIRGRNSLRREGNDPLYIIDGVPILSESPSKLSATVFPYSSLNPLNSLNPNDIQSIEILKDADATAIYGSRGANGVILVTTRKGRKGRTDFRLNSSYSLSELARKMKMMNTEQYLGMRRKAFSNDGLTVYPATAYDINGTWGQNRSVNWQDELIGKTAVSTQAQASLSGGSETTDYLISFGHQKQTTVFPADFGYTTNNVATSFSYRTPDRRLELGLANQLSFQKNTVISEDLTNKTLTLSPNAPRLYSSDGSLNWENNTFTNPLAAFLATYTNSTKFLNTNMNAQYRLAPQMTLRLNSGISWQAFEEWSLKPHTVNNPSYGLTSANSTAFKNSLQSFSYILEPQWGWERKWGSHAVELLVGGTVQQAVSDQAGIQGYGFESNALMQNLGAAKTKVVTDQVRSQYRYAAGFGRLNYRWKKRYILNMTGRRDGSSRFGPNNRFANFGALGAAWIFSDEPFLQESSWLSFGKLRGSIGTAGNDRIGDYMFLNTYTVGSNIYDGTTGLNPSRLYNPDFSWEQTVKTEAALELSFLKDRLSLTGAWYRNRSSNQLVGIPLPFTTGFSSVQANLPATVQNTGWELELSAKPITAAALKWETGFNISIPNSKLLSFPGLEGSTYVNQFVVGQPLTLVKVYQLEGIDPVTGLYRFMDFNGDGKISSPDDNKVIERVGVEYFGGWNNRLRYKQLELSFLFQFVKQRNWNYNRIMPTPGTMNNQPVEVLNAWAPENPDAAYMAYTSGSNAQKNAAHSYFQNSTAAVGDASFIRLKNVQLNFRLPSGLVGLKEAMVYVQGQNLLTLTNYFGLDPEFILTGYLPPLKTWSAGVQLNF